MNIDAGTILTWIKELGALGLLAGTLFKGIPALVEALDRNTRMLYRIEGKLGIESDSDRLEKK